MVNFAARPNSFASAVSSLRLPLFAGAVGVGYVISLLGTPEDGT